MAAGSMPTWIPALLDASPGEIAGVGMLIVLSALLLLSFFIAALPRVLRSLAAVWPEKESIHAAVEAHPENMTPDDDAVLAAIGFVLHTEYQRELQAASQSSQ